MEKKPDLNEIQKRLEAVEHKLGVYYDPKAEPLLEEIFAKLDSRTLQLILREIDAKILELAIMGFQAPALKGLHGALSKKAWEMITEDLQYYLKLSATEASVHQARIEIMNIVHKLINLGEIVLVIPGSSPRLEEWIKGNHNTIGTSYQKAEGLEAWKKDVFDKV